MSENLLNPSEPYAWSRCAHLGASELRALITTSGAIQVKRYCLDCDEAITSAISHQGIDVTALPVHADYRRADAPCGRCGSMLGVEEHHWAPRHLFEDFEQWPTSYLCPSCHDRWHQTVTPRMTERRAS